MSPPVWPASVSSKPAAAAGTFGLLAAPLAALLAACVPTESPLSMPLQRLTERGAQPVDRTGMPLGPADPTPIEEAAKRLVEREMATADDDSMPGEAPYELSIESLRADVIENNLDLRVAVIGPRIAAEAVNAERAKFDAVFVADVSYLDADLPAGNTTLLGVGSATGALGEGAGSFTELDQQREQLKIGTGLNVPLPTGGRIGIANELEIDDKEAGSIVSTEDRSSLSFSISQPLLRGGGVAVNTASIRLARLDAGVSEAQTKLTVIRVLAAAEKSYWRAYAAQKTLEVRREQLGLASENLTLVNRLIDAGSTPEVERFSAELAVAQQIEALVIAETDVRLRSRELARVLNRPDLPLSEPRPILATSDPRLTRFRVDPDALAERAIRERLELLELELQLAADAIRVDLARNAALPVFVVDFQYGIAEREGTLASSFSESFGFGNDSVAIGARAAIPVTNDAAEAGLRRTVLGRVQRLATRDQRRQQIEQEVHDAADVLNLSWQRILAARQNVVAAAANYQAEQQLFREGLRNAQDVLFALQVLGDARQREVGVVLAYQIAQIDLAFATGVLLGYAGAELEDAPPTAESPG